MSAISLTLKAGNHERRHCPVSVVVETPPGQGVAVLKNAAGQPVPHQCRPLGQGKVQVSWIVDFLAVGQSTSYQAELGPDCEAAGSGVEVQDRPGERIDVCIGGQLFTSYYYASSYARPFFYPLIGPHGDSVTRHYPMQELPDERHDHPHHRSLWVAHGDVNGVDNWSELEGHGRILQREVCALHGGPVFGHLCTHNDWVSPAGQKVVSEHRCVKIYHLPSQVRLIDFDITFTATEGDVKFGDTKEGGIVSVRVASSMDVPVGGRITNSYNGLNEAETWGKRAHWCAYAGPVKGNLVGIAVFDHPTSFRHPTYWHVRDYGLMTANCFGLSHFHNDPNLDGSYVLPAGKSLHFAYRVYIHSGDTVAGRVGERYHDYVNPPQITVES